MIVQAPEMREKQDKRRGRSGFRAHKLFDYLLERYDFKTDFALAEWMGIEPPAISRIRHGTHRVGPTMILAIYDATDMTIEQIRGLCEAEG